jgi:NAD+ synthase (glutamine-hydrolysing)
MTFRLAVAQLNLLVGDVTGNGQRIVEAAAEARDRLNAHAIVFPELALTSYPPEDLLLRPDLKAQVAAALRRIKREAKGITLLLGYPQAARGHLYNALSAIHDGRVLATYRKQLLPNYGVFDEKRYFTSGKRPCVIEIAGAKVGLAICEDIWAPEVVARTAAAGARLIVVPNASPYHMQKGRERERIVADRVREGGVPVVYANLVGGQDELVFDGDSFVMDAEGEVAMRLPAFKEEIALVEFRDEAGRLAPVEQSSLPVRPLEKEVWSALTLGLRDYVNKNGFPGIVLGLSGGIDSALVLCIAVDALGAERVEAVMMPSRYTADMSLQDAEAQARTLGVKYRVIPIEPMIAAFTESLKGEFAGLPADATEENIQARIRGTLLMAVSNKTGRMVVATGNKSEMAVGYATLYGDMVGGFAVIKDVFKTMVYRLAAWRNRKSPVIPQRVIERPPSAELRADQKDTDSLPPYDVLDPILERYIERDMAPETIVAEGFDATVVARVVRMVDRNEYKRRQAAPGVRITRRAFGRDRRYPITSGYREL